MNKYLLVQRRARYRRSVPCTLEMQPLSYALKTWKDKKEQFTTRNKMFTDTGHTEGRGGARSPLLFPLSQDVYWVLLLSGPS